MRKPAQVLPTNGLLSELGRSFWRERSGKADAAKAWPRSQAIQGTSGRRRVMLSVVVSDFQDLTDLCLCWAIHLKVSSVIRGAPAGS